MRSSLIRIMEQKKHSFNQDSPIYNIRLLRIYIDYIESNYPNVNIDKILNFTGISRLQLMILVIGITKSKQTDSMKLL